MKPNHLFGDMAERTVQGIVLAATLAFVGCDKGTQTSGTLVGAGAPAEEPGELLVGVPESWGQKLRSTQNMSMTNGKMSITVAGQAMDGTITSEGKRVVEYELVSATERNVQVTEGVENTSQVMMGQPIDNNEESPLVGIPLKATLEDNAWKLSLAEGEATDAQAEELKSLESAEDDTLYPTDRLEVGDEFDIVDEQVAGLLHGLEVKNLQGGGKGKLEELLDYAGHKCARVSVDLEVKGTLVQEGQELQAELKIAGELVRSLDVYEDIKADLSGSMSAGGEVEIAPGQAAPVSISADIALNIESEAL